MSHPLITWKKEWYLSADKQFQRLFRLSIAALFLAMVIIITRLLESEALLAFDRSILAEVAQMRTPLLNNWAINITALGSSIVLTIVTVAALGILLFVVKDPYSALQLVLASGGAGILVNVGKTWIARGQPDPVNSLVTSAGFSYPSGHSLSSAAIYLMLALLACRPFHSRVKRSFLIGTAFAVISLVGFTRIYLGVHYPSDVLSGILLGAAWALCLGAIRRPLEAVKVD